MATINTRIVLRNDTADNWKNVNPTLLEGEMGVETDTGLFKFGKLKEVVEGVNVYYNWNDLEYANDIPDVDLSTVTNEVKFAETLAGLGDGTVVGDIGIVKAPLYSGATEYTYTAYVWSKVNEGYDWAAMDGNYSAANVFIPEEITLSGDFGSVYDTADKKYYAITTLGNKKIGDSFAAGTSMQTMWSEILSKRLQPSKTDPSISISASGDDGNKETGTSYTKPTGTLTVNAGNYTYGYKDSNGTKQSGTGVTFPTAKIATGLDDTITTENQYSTATNLAGGGTVSIAPSKYASSATTALYTDDSVGYSFSANASHTAGAIAIDNLGAPSDPTIQIGAVDKITATDKTVYYRGYRKMFCGCTSATLNSATIRGLTLKSAKAAKGAFEVTAPEGATQIVLALPTKSVGKKYTMTKAEMYTSNWEDYTSLFSTAQTIQVADARGESNGLQNYNVYTYSFAALKANTRFQFTVAEANA